YELLTDRPLFDVADERALIAAVLRDEPTAPRKANPRLPEDLATIVAKCIAKDPRERYRSARAVADDLQAFLDGRPIAARPRASRLPQATRPRPSVNSPSAIRRNDDSSGAIWTGARTRRRSASTLMRAGCFKPSPAQTAAGSRASPAGRCRRWASASRATPAR